MTDALPAEGWQIGGDSAAAYEQYLVPQFFEPGAELLIGLAELGPGERALDVACGTGIVSRRAALRVGQSGHVAGLDLNETMLRAARSFAADARPAIEWRQGSAASIPFPDGAFDAVFCQQGVQFFSDPAAALAEMRRVLNGRGRLALSACRDLRYSPGYTALAEALEEFVSPEVASMMRSPFWSASTGQLRALLTGAGFGDVRIQILVAPVRYPSCSELLRREAASSPFAATIAGLQETRREAMIRRLEEKLADRLDDEGLIFPIEITAALARR